MLVRQKIRWYFSFFEDANSMGSVVIIASDSRCRYLPVGRSPIRVNVHLGVIGIVAFEVLPGIEDFTIVIMMKTKKCVINAGRGEARRGTEFMSKP